MRISFLATQDLESPSMLGRWWPLACELARLGHQVTIYTLHSKYRKHNPNVFTRNGVNVHYVAPMHVWKEGDVKGYYPAHQLIKVAFQATWRQVSAVVTSPADIIQICKPHPMNSLAGLAAKILSSSMVCLDCDDYEAGSGRFGAEWQRSGVAFFERLMPRQAQLVTTNTHFMRDKLIEWQVPEGRIYYLPNGVDPRRFKPPNPIELKALRSQLGLENQRVVAFIGSLSLPSHPVDLLIQAFAKLHASIPNITLLVVGGGEDLATLKEQAAVLGISQAVVFTGRVPPEKTVFYYHLAEMTVDPLHDNDTARGRLPLKMFESWACGIPFVTANVGDRSWLAGDPPSALLVQPGSAQALAESIQRLLYSPQKAASLRAHGLERVKDFTWDKLACKMEGLYRDLLERRSGRIARERKT